MRTADIKVRAVYEVRLSENQSLVYGGCVVVAEVVRKGFHYEVEHRQASRVRNAPFVRYEESAHPNGVEVRWQPQRVETRARHEPWTVVAEGVSIINARQVLRRIYDLREVRTAASEQVEGAK